MVSGYLRDLYQTPGFGDTTDFQAIKVHYHLSNHIASDDQKSYHILPKGPDLSGLHTGEFMDSAMRLYDRLDFERIAQLDFVPADDGIVVKAFRLNF